MLTGSQIVNGLGKYFKKHLTGSGEIKHESNVCIVTISLLYSVKSDGDSPDETGTITVQIYVKTYDNKIAVSIFDGDFTIDYKAYPVASFEDYETACEKALSHSKKRISRNYPNYDFQFDSL